MARKRIKSAAESEKSFGEYYGKEKDLPEKSNSGFSLITVILAVGLVGILVMLIAYMVIANFRMKMSGLREKDAFIQQNGLWRKFVPVCRKM